MDLTVLSIIALACNLTVTEPPISYSQEQINIDGYEQQIYSAIVDLSDDKITLNNNLSRDKIYGFETTSSVAKRKQALLAFNGMFYTDSGMHIGGLIENGEIITLPYEQTPMILIDDKGEIFIEDIKIHTSISTSKKEIKIDGQNRKPYGLESILYASIYGIDTRVETKSVGYILKDNVVSQVIKSDKPILIPEYGKLLVDYGENIKLDKGDKVSIIYSSDREIEKIIQGFQSGGWLIQEGKTVVKSSEVLIGLTTNREPRTLLGKNKAGKLVVVVVDGRQPGYSIGVTGIEAAELMRKLGCVDAVLLDGGASSTLVINGELINKPSFRQREKKIAHIITIEKNTMIKKMTQDSCKY